MMRIGSWSIWILSLLVLSGTFVAEAQTPPPTIFFTDLTSGPNSGGDNQGGFAGAYVTIYGNFFGSSQGSSTVTWNGQNCLRVVPLTGNYTGWGRAHLWYQEIIVQLGPNCTPGTGDFVVTVNGVASNAVHVIVGGVTVDNASFTVRAGNIYCVATNGNDSNQGTFAGGCWRTISHAAQGAAPVVAGDTIYVEDGVTQAPGSGGYSDTLSIGVMGSPTNPIGLLAYPGANVTIGTVTGDNRGVLVCNGLSQCTNGQWWTFAGLNLRAVSEAYQSGGTGQDPGIRLIASDLYCPNGSDQAGCLQFSSPNSFVYGNLIHDTGMNTAATLTKLYHAAYISDGSQSIDIGWNMIANNHANRGFQVFTSSVSIEDVHIHDNLIHDNRGTAIFLSDVAPTASAPVEAYNNIVYNSGTGPDFPEGPSVYDCAEVDTGGPTTAPSLFYNNTLFNCGSGGGGAINVPSTGPGVIKNNIIYNTRAYLDAGSSTAKLICTNNLFFGNGASPSGCTTGAINLDPLFNNLSSLDFRLTTNSPAVDAGLTFSKLTWDHDGSSRPQGAAYDIGGYEYFVGGSTVQRPNPPTNLTVTVK